jgi:Ser/Thr protein kinase RdoA (MazF antagonist)
MSKSPESLEFLAARPPEVPLAQVSRVVKDHFELRGDYTPLVSERDQNFRLAADDGNDYVIKISHPSEDTMVTDRQVELLLHLEAFGDVLTPIVVRTSAGECRAVFELSGEVYSLRVVSYLDGTTLSALTLTDEVAADFGAKLARLDHALESFSTKGENPFSLWDLQQATALRDLQQYIDDPDIRSVVARTLDRFEASVAPRLRKLPRQAIHGDANPENVIVDAASKRVSGFIDFDDAVFAPRVVDVAIAASYLRAEEPQPLRLITAFIGAYQSVQQLNPEEQELLLDLVRTRLATTITMLYWRLSAREDDDPYRQKTLQSEGGAIHFLRLLERH